MILEATRETFWTIGPVGKVLFHYLAVVTILIFCSGVYARFTRYSRGSQDPVDRLTDLPTRVIDAIGIVISNKRQFDHSLYSGLTHAFILWGFLTLLVATIILGIDIDLYRPLTGESFWTGKLYLAYQFAVDALGLVFVVGLGMAIIRRYRRREGRLWSRHGSLEDDALVWSLFILGVGGFAMEALSMVGQPGRSRETVSVVGYSIATGLSALGVTPELAASIYTPLWWSHALLALTFIAWIPYAKPFHMLSSFVNVVTRDEKAGSRLPSVPPDLDHTFAETLDDFTWRQLLAQDACVKCGRCSSVCPATTSGRPLDPRDLILDLKACRESRDEHPVTGRSGGVSEQSATDGGAVPIVSESGGVIEVETVESCMSCMACMEACPVAVEHLTTVTRLNRQCVDTGTLEDSLQNVFQNVMTDGNVFGESQRTRGDWAGDLAFDITDARETDVEFLWYVGDYPSFDERNTQIAKSLAKLFQHAGVEFGILFDDERADGNDIRRLGEEFLYLELAGHHVESFDACEFEKIVCTDPHSYNTFSNEYPEIDFGEYASDPMVPFEYDGRWNEDGEIPVYHWTRAIEELIEQERLDLDGTELDYTVTYHDPCHLGRYNDEYETPRRLIEATGARLCEMPRNRDESVCCGGGGGGLWLEFDEDPKPSEERLRETIEDIDTEPAVEKFVVACPICLTMFEDGHKTGDFDDDLEIIDLAELVIEAVAESERSVLPIEHE